MYDFSVSFYMEVYLGPYGLYFSEGLVTLSVFQNLTHRMQNVFPR